MDTKKVKNQAKKLGAAYKRAERHVERCMLMSKRLENRFWLLKANIEDVFYLSEQADRELREVLAQLENMNHLVRARVTRRKRRLGK